MTNDLSTFIHNLRAVLADSRRRLVRLSITTVVAAGLIWLLGVQAQTYEVAGEREVAGFLTGIAFCVLIAAILQFVGWVVSAADPTIPHPVTATTEPWPSVDGEDQHR